MLSINENFAQPALSANQIENLDRLATQDVPPAAPGIATAIISQGRVIYKKYAGYANLTDSLLIDKNTRFNIASNGKQFTALAVLILAKNKKLSLSEDVRKYFPKLFPAIKDKITIGSLLNHTSGIRDCYDLWNIQGYTWWQKTFSNKDVLSLVEKQEELNFAPGTRYLYSNTNYILLSLIIEQASGQSFGAFTTNLFRLLHMPNTSFECDFLQIRGPKALAYFNFSDWTTYEWKWNVCGDGNFFTTLEDMIQWEKIIQGTGQTNIDRRIILESQQPLASSTYKNYGYGLEFGIYKGMPYSFHEGATGAWKATVIRFPERKTSLITMTNTGKAIPAEQTRQMADYLFDFPKEQNLIITKPEKTGPYLSENEIAGTYITPDDFVFTLEWNNQQLLLKRQGRNNINLEREGPNIFHQKTDSLFKLEFTTNLRGEMQVTAYYINHAPYTLTRQNADLKGFDYSLLNGRYYNIETNTSLHIRYLFEKSYEIIFSGGADTTIALLLNQNKLLANGYSLNVAYGTKNSNTIFLSSGRVKQLRYKKL
jgi:CubicO group peptidase (beta-lactamase class C family)